MRFLILTLLIVGVAAAYFIQRPSPQDSPGGAGPATELARPETKPGALVLDGGSGVSGTRAASTTTAGSAPAAATAPAVEEPAQEPVPEPSLEGGGTTERVGTKSYDALDEEFAAKYRDASRPERLQALEVLRATFEQQISSGGKGDTTDFEPLKREMTWLETNLDE